MKKFFVLIATLMVVSACSLDPETVTIRETVIARVPVTVEVTREVETVKTVEVTRLIEFPVTVTPSPTVRIPPTHTRSGPDLGDRDMPNPMGQPVELVMGGEIEFTMMVLEVIRGDIAFQRIRAANQFNDPPPPGFEFILIYIEISYTGNDRGVLEIGKFDMSMVTDGRIITYDDTFTYSPCCIEPDFELELLQGGTGAGWVALPVSIDDTEPLLLIGGSDGIYFSLTSEE